MQSEGEWIRSRINALSLDMFTEGLDILECVRASLCKVAHCQVAGCDDTVSFDASEEKQCLILCPGGSRLGIRKIGVA